MKHTVKKIATRQAIALALTWDGARWPVKSLPTKARAFLATTTKPIRKITPLFVRDQVREIRICWVPCLQGGDPVLAEPFATLNGLRIKFRATRISRFGDVLGVVYRRA